MRAFGSLRHTLLLRQPFVGSSLSAFLLPPTSTSHSFQFVHKRNFCPDDIEDGDPILPDPGPMIEMLKTPVKDLKKPWFIRYGDEPEKIDYNPKYYGVIFKGDEVHEEPWYDPWEVVPPRTEDEIPEHPEKVSNMAYRSPFWPFPQAVRDRLAKEPVAVFTVPPTYHRVESERRIEIGCKRYMNKLRKEGYIPAILYRKRSSPVHLKIKLSEAESAVDQRNGFPGSRFLLVIDGKEHVAYGQKMSWDVRIGISSPTYLRFMDFIPTPTRHLKCPRYVPQNPFNSGRLRVKGKGKKKTIEKKRDRNGWKYIWGRSGKLCNPDWNSPNPQYELDLEDQLHRDRPLPENLTYVRSTDYLYIKNHLDQIPEQVYDYEEDHKEDDPWTKEDETLNQTAIRMSMKNKKYRVKNRQAKNYREIIQGLAKE